jgi:hypothetical protein
MFYTSGSQPGVRVPLGVRVELTGGTRNYFDERKNSYFNESKKAFFKNFIKCQKRKINIKKLIKKAFIKKYLCNLDFNSIAPKLGV